MRLRSLALALVAVLAGAPAAAQQAPPAALPMAQLDFPPFQERTLSNGARLLVVNQEEVPFVTLRVVMRGGTAVDPLDKVGLAAFAAQLLTKGTTARSANEIAEAIDFVGGSLDANAAADWINITLGVLEPDLATGLALLADVIMNPTFPEDELELVRTRGLSGLQASLAEPDVLASRAFLRAVYGAHAYGKLESVATLQAIDRAALQAFHAGWFRPGNALFVVAGSVTADEIAPALEAAFRGWSAGTAQEPSYGTPPAPAKEVILVHRPGSVQAVVRAGHLVARGNNPDWTTLAVANQVLGGGITSRHFQILREEKGWTYGAYSQGTRRRDLGVWQAAMEARNEVAADAIAEMLVQIERIRSEPIPEDELEITKSFMVGSFPLSIETPQQIANQVASNRLLGLPDDALETYRARVAALDASDVRRVATDHLRPDRMILVVVGDAAELQGALARFGTVRVVDSDGSPVEIATLLPESSGERFDASLLRPGTYAYRVLMEGNEVGTMQRELAPVTMGDGPALSYRGTIAVGPQKIETGVVFGVPGFDARAASMSMAMGGQNVSMDARVVDGRLVGSVNMPDGAQTLDRPLPEGALIADMVEVALWIAELEEGKEIRVPVARLETGAVEGQIMRVGAIEEVTVPAGAFRAFRVEIEGSESQTVWARVEAPHVLLKLVPAGQPLTLELVTLPR
jgi:zinc protease